MKVNRESIVTITLGELEQLESLAQKYRDLEATLASCGTYEIREDDDKDLVIINQTGKEKLGNLVAKLVTEKAHDEIIDFDLEYVSVWWEDFEEE